ncbi:MAG: hypothetical protein ACFE9L_05270 [Candidatus Hodarchaeota archaeon]
MSLLMPNLLSEEDPEQEPFLNLIRMWQRIEPYSADRDLNPALQAKISDPVWLLTRQWQTGEFIAESAGSPVFAYLNTEWDIVSRIKRSNESDVEHISKLSPIEFIIENAPTITSKHKSFKTRVQITNQFKRELLRKGLTSNQVTAILEVLIQAGLDSMVFDTSIFEKVVEKKVKSYLMSFLGNDLTHPKNIIDGLILIKTDVNTLLPIIEAARGNAWPDSEHDNIKEVFQYALRMIKTKFKSIYNLGDNPNLSWNDKLLGYQFSLGTPPDQDPKIFRVSRYDGHNFDWYSLSVDPNIGTSIGGQSDPKQQELDERGERERKTTFIPTNLYFHGMPNPRWWQFEDGDTDFGDLSLDKPDISKLLTMHFALIMSNDWYVIPFPVEVGSIVKIKSLKIKDVFGKEIFIPRLGGETATDPSFKNWDLFSMSIQTQSNISNPCSQPITLHSLYIPPSIGKKDESPDLEVVNFTRDPMANLVWGVENRIPSLLGNSVDGFYHQLISIQDEISTVYLTAWPNFLLTIQPNLEDLHNNITTHIVTTVKLIGVNNDLVELDALPPSTTFDDYLLIAKDIVLQQNELYQALLNIHTSGIDENGKRNQILALTSYPEPVNTELQDIELQYDQFFEKAHDYIRSLALDDHTGFQKIYLLLKNSNEMKLLQNIKEIFQLISIIATSEERNEKPRKIEDTLLLLSNLTTYGDASETVKQTIEDLKQETSDFIIDLNIDKLRPKENTFASYKLKSPIPENRVPYLALREVTNFRSVNWRRVKLKRDHPQLLPIDIDNHTEIVKESSLIFEEVVNRSGLEVKSNIQRTRWFGGKTYIWKGRKVSIGKGESQSGLKFDYLNEESRT